jgi:hypothetical protein
MDELIKTVLKKAGLSTQTVMLLSTGIYMAVDDIKKKIEDEIKED